MEYFTNTFDKKQRRCIMYQSDTQKNWNEFWEREREKQYRQQKKKSGCLIPTIIFVCVLGLILFFAVGTTVLQAIKTNNQIRNTELAQNRVNHIQNTGEDLSQVHETAPNDVRRYNKQEGSLDYNTGIYLKSERNLRDAINDYFEITITNYKNGITEIDIIDLQIKINEYREKLEELEKLNVKKEFKDHKTEGYNYLKSTIDLLDKYTTSNTLDIYNISTLYKGFAEKNNSHFENLKRLFDENNIDYTLSKKEDGNEQIEYYYKSPY